MPADRDVRGALLLVTSLGQAREVTRSSAGGVEALALHQQENQEQELDSSLRWNDEQEVQELDSRFRGNDERESKKLDYTRLLPRALRAPRCANVRFGILP